MRILLAEDEKDLNYIIVQKLTADGYSVDCCFDGEEAIDIISYTDFDAIILDIMMPKADGFAVLDALRSMNKMTPVIFLTARDSVSDRVKGLDRGANDYLVKPFSFEELSARLRVMTRTSYGVMSNVICVSDLSMDCNAHTVSRGRVRFLQGTLGLLPAHRRKGRHRGVQCGAVRLRRQGPGPHTGISGGGRISRFP